MLALVGDGEPLARVVRGLPAGRELGTYALERHAPVGRRDATGRVGSRAGSNALLLAQQRATGRLGRVRGGTGSMLSDRAGDRPLQRVAERLEPLEAFREAARLRPAAVVEVPRRRRTRVHLLRHVDHLEPGRERPDQVGRLRRTAPRNGRRVRGSPRNRRRDDGSRAAGRPRPRGTALAALVAQHFAHERAERVSPSRSADVLRGKRNVLAWHGRGGCVGRRCYSGPRRTGSATGRGARITKRRRTVLLRCDNTSGRLY